MREFLQKKAILAAVGGLGLVAGSYLLWGSESTKHEAVASTAPVVRKTSTADTAAEVKRRPPKAEPVAAAGAAQPRTRVDESAEPIVRKPKPREDIRVRTKKPAPLG